jgi:Family of unknown function (DUF5709)
LARRVSDPTFGDAVYEAGADPDDDLTYTAEPEDQLATADPDEPVQTDYSPPDYEPKATRWGTTDLEQQLGEPLDMRLAEEEPDITPDDLDDEVADERAGRLIAPDEGAHPDAESDSVATDVGPAGYAASAEEAAMHVVDGDEETDAGFDDGDEDAISDREIR